MPQAKARPERKLRIALQEHTWEFAFVFRKPIHQAAMCRIVGCRSCPGPEFDFDTTAAERKRRKRRIAHAVQQGFDEASGKSVGSNGNERDRRDTRLLTS